MPRNSAPFSANAPLVSIVTPCLNSQSFLEETVLSVAAQTYSNIEYIVVDGGSTDGTLDIVKRHQDGISRWVSEEDEGQADALRKGFGMAHGEVLAWINSDDVYPRDAVAEAVRVLRESGADVVYGNRALISERGRRIGERRLSPFLPFFSRRGMLYGGFGVYQPAAFWTRDIYDRAQGIDPSYSFAMDTDLFTRFVMAGARFKFLRREMVEFRVHEGSKTSTALDVAREEWERISRGLPHRGAPYRWTIRLACRAWKALYQLRDTGGRYLVSRLLDKEYRFVP